jgi:hypothetical protein
MGSRSVFRITSSFVTLFLWHLELCAKRIRKKCSRELNMIMKDLTPFLHFCLWQLRKISNN